MAGEACELNDIFPNIKWSLRLCLSDTFSVLANATIIIGVFQCIPKGRYAILRVWFYYAGMTSFIMIIYDMIAIINQIPKLI